MASWAVRQYNDIKGNAKWALLVVLWGSIVAGLKQILQQVPHFPGWGTLLILVAVSLAAFIWLAKSQKAVSQQPITQTVAIAPGQAGGANLDATLFFRTAYYSQLTDEVERNIRASAAHNQPNDREGFLAKFIGIGYVAYLHDITWAYIYKSQILVLTELNRRGGLMPVADAKAYFDKAETEYPQVYATYSFEGWLKFMLNDQLIIHHPSNMLEITIRGRDFLKYLTHWGRHAGKRSG